MDKMTVRCKMKCKVKKVNETDGGGTVAFEPVTTGSKENDEFFKYTPLGGLEVGPINQTAFDAFEEGKEYYVDITPSE